MKTSSLVLLAGVGFVAYTYMRAKRGTTAKATSASAARYFGPQLSGVFMSREPNPAADGTIVDNYLDLLFAPGGFYGGQL